MATPFKEALTDSLTPTRPRMVIVGQGIAGVKTLTELLSKRLEILVIERREKWDLPQRIRPQTIIDLFLLSNLPTHNLSCSAGTPRVELMGVTQEIDLMLKDDPDYRFFQHLSQKNGVISLTDYHHYQETQVQRFIKSGEVPQLIHLDLSKALSTADALKVQELQSKLSAWKQSCSDLSAAEYRFEPIKSYLQECEQNGWTPQEFVKTERAQYETALQQNKTLEEEVEKTKKGIERILKETKILAENQRLDSIFIPNRSPTLRVVKAFSPITSSIKTLKGNQYKVTSVNGKDQTLTLLGLDLETPDKPTSIPFDHFVAADGHEHTMVNLLSQSGPEFTVTYELLPVQPRQKPHGAALLYLKDKSLLKDERPLVAPNLSKMQLKHLPQLKQLGWDKNYLPMIFIQVDDKSEFYVTGEIPSSFLDPEKASHKGELLQSWGCAVLQCEFDLPEGAFQKFERKFKEESKEPKEKEETKVNREGSFLASTFLVEIASVSRNVVKLGKGGIAFIVGDSALQPCFCTGSGIKNAEESAKHVGMCFDSEGNITTLMPMEKGLLDLKANQELGFVRLAEILPPTHKPSLDPTNIDTGAVASYLPSDRNRAAATVNKDNKEKELVPGGNEKLSVT